MKHSAAAAMLTMIFASGFTGDLAGCGDKFIVPTRATRFTTPPLKREDASILLYSSPSSELARTLTRLSVAQTLQKAGYRVLEVSDNVQLVNALSQRRWDLAVVDFNERQAVAGRSVAVIPVSYGLTNAQWKEAKGEYRFIVKAPTKARTLLDAVDAALAAHADKKP